MTRAGRIARPTPELAATLNRQLTRAEEEVWCSPRRARPGAEPGRAGRGRRAAGKRLERIECRLDLLLALLAEREVARQRAGEQLLCGRPPADWRAALGPLGRARLARALQARSLEAADRWLGASAAECRAAGDDRGTAVVETMPAAAAAAAIESRVVGAAAHFARGERQAAIEMLLESWRKPRARDGASARARARGVILLGLRDPDRRGIAAAVSAIGRAAARRGDRRLVGLALAASARTGQRRKSGDLDPVRRRRSALKRLKRAAALLEAAGALRDAASAHLDRGVLLAGHKPAAAVAATRRAITLFQRAGAPRLAGRAWLNLAALQMLGGDDQGAFASSETARRLLAGSGDAAELGRALDRLAMLHARLGDAGIARTLWRRALALVQSTPHRAQAAKIASNLAALLQRCGGAEEARALLLPWVLPNAEEEQQIAPFLPRILHNLAACEQLLGLRRDAIPGYLERALQLARRQRQAADEALLEAQLGAYYHETESAGDNTRARYEKALHHYEAALALCRDVPHQPRAGWIQGLRALLLADLGRQSAATRAFRAAIATCQAHGHTRDEARERCHWGLAALRNHWPPDRALLRGVGRALPLLRRANDPRTHAEALLINGTLQARAGREAAALRLIRKACDLLETHLVQLASPLARRTAADDLDHLLGAALEAILDLPAPHLAELYRLLESFRARLLLDQATAGGVVASVAPGAAFADTTDPTGTNAPAAPSPVATTHRLQMELAHLRDRLWQTRTLPARATPATSAAPAASATAPTPAQAPPPNTLQQHLRTALAAKERQLSDHLQALQINRPLFARLAGAGHSLSLAALQSRCLGPGEALLLIRVLESRTLLFWIETDRVHLETPLLGAARLSATIAEIRARMTLATRKSYDPALQVTPLETQLLAPLDPLLRRIRRLYIAASGPLAELPFALFARFQPPPPDAAPTAAETSPPRPAAPRPPTHLYIESASLLAPDLTPPHQDAPLDYLGIGGVIVPGERPLPQSGSEIRAAATHFATAATGTGHPRPRTRLLLGSKATKAAYFTHAPHARYLHIAAHATPRPDHPALAALHLAAPTSAAASPGDPSPRGDTLQAHEIQNCRLRARLVVLSACSSARGGLSESEGIRGLAHAFRAAGAGTVLATAWPVHDAAMALLMDFLFAEIVAAPSANLAHCLQRAVGRLRHPMPDELTQLVRREFRHPYFWAGLLLIGSGR